jgi:hypothetical protein
MARTNLNTIEGTENAESFATSDDQAAWNAACEAMGFRVWEKNVVGGQKEYLYVIPAPDGFASVPTSFAGFLAYSIVKHIEYRIAQTGSGDLNEAAAKFISELGSFKPARSMDAAERIFYLSVENGVRAAIVDADGNYVEDTSKLEATKTWLLPMRGANGERQLQLSTKSNDDAWKMDTLIEKVAKENQGNFDTVVQQGLEKGRNKPASEKAESTGRKGRAPRSLDFGIPIV